MGLSVRPPPAMMPTIARHSLLTVFFAPDGMRMRVVPYQAQNGVIESTKNIDRSDEWLSQKVKSDCKQS
jgi:hypothetical protein